MDNGVSKRKLGEKMNSLYQVLHVVVQRVLKVVNLNSPALTIDPEGQFEALLMGQFGALMMQTKKSTIFLDEVKRLISMSFKVGAQRMSLPTKATSKLGK